MNNPIIEIKAQENLKILFIISLNNDKKSHTYEILRHRLRPKLYI